MFPRIRNCAIPLQLNICLTQLTLVIRTTDPAISISRSSLARQISKTLGVIQEQCSILRFLHIGYLHCTLSVQQARSSKEGPLSKVETACLQRGSNSCIRLPT
jgi:DNA polymerase III psi subunit